MSKCLSWAVVVVMAAFGAQGASWVVWPGQSLQAAITNAASGDNITLKEGVYVENITLTKGLDIRGETGKELTTSVQGTWTIQNASAPVYLKGFKIGVSVTGNVNVANCTDVRFDYITANPSALMVLNTKFYLYRSSFSGDASFNGGDFTLQKSTVSGNLASTNTDTKILASTVSGNLSHLSTAKNCTVFQSTVGTKLYVSALNYWIGYNTIQYAEVRDGSGTCEIVGNRFDGRGTNSNFNGLTIVNTSPIVRNNFIGNYRSDSTRSITITQTFSDSANGIYVSSGNPVIANNVLTNVVAIANNSYSSVYNDNLNRCGNGVYVASGNARVINCVIAASASADGSLTASGNAVYGTGSVEVKYCNTYGSTYQVGGGCVATNCISINPLLTNDCVLLAGSPCINAGAPAPEYYDLDNTRNNMGMWGGHSYDPAGRTTVKPVVISTDASPLYVKRGQNIMLKARGAVAAP